MKNILLAVVALALVVPQCFSQAKRPTIMVVPSNVWCNQNGYVTTFDNQGHEEQIPDYKRALDNDPDLLLAISKLGEMMSERGFPLKDLGASLRSLQNEAAEESLTTSKDSGDGLAESPLDRLKRVANADIWMQLTYTINKTGPQESVTFNLQGLDAYTDKQIAAASGTGEKSIGGTPLPVMIEEAVLVHIDNFNNQLQSFFDDLAENGREITLTCRRWNDSDIDFESEFDGEELGFLIEDWLADNTVNGRFNTSMASENRMVFEQVRIPLENARGRALDARTWANDCRRYFRDKYDIDMKVSTKGLGGAILTLGGN